MSYTKYLKQHWRSDDFGRGKSIVAKARQRRVIKKQAKRHFNKENAQSLIIS